ncbi:hypothetical protein GCM10010096_11660 [Alcaligenes pakistanensis]|uniref:Uncharacterized protein n=1 Tax=Alcaligenes pakistanensis TaxID=1482717 RepID=A0A8H9IMI5_9BURK|nr:hypothetical protein [Alcaligenes pakistanensis]GHC42511.1 hypothetical protein GCM10010096_11660 [Alcaligenes pakistanensis]
MKIEEAIAIVAGFFNDLIGAWVPGAVFAVGFGLMHLGPARLQAILNLLDSSAAALTAAGLLFALGHVLLAVHEHGVKKLLTWIRISSKFDDSKAKKRLSYVRFSDLINTSQTDSGPADWDYKDLRSVALSVSSEAASIGRRFTFVSLLCNGIGTALSIIAIDFAVCHLVSPKLLYSYDHAAPWFVQVLLFFGVAVTLFKQGEVFYSRAMTTPFSIAVAELKLKKDANVNTPTS